MYALPVPNRKGDSAFLSVGTGAGGNRIVDPS